MATKITTPGTGETGPEIARPRVAPSDPLKIATGYFEAKRRFQERYCNRMSPCILEFLGINPANPSTDEDIQLVNDEYEKRAQLAEKIDVRLDDLLGSDHDEELVYNRKYSLPTMARLGILRQSDAGEDMWAVEIDRRDCQTLSWEELVIGHSDKSVHDHIASRLTHMQLTDEDAIGLSLHLRTAYQVVI